MKLIIPNKADIKEFELEYKPITLEIYYNQFGRDLSIDYINDLRIEGGISRTLSQRLIWSMCVTENNNFMTFVEFINILEYNIYNFLETWGKDFTNWFIPLVDSDFTK